MATLIVTGPTSINMSNPNLVDHAAQAAPVHGSQYSWTTTSGNLIHAYSFAGDISFDATTALSGSIQALNVVGSYWVGNMAGDLVAMTAGLNNENYWRTILAGETTILADAANFDGAGDFVSVGAGEVLAGADDLFEGATAGVTQGFSGDARRVEVGAELTGGDDTINMRGTGSISGDADFVRGTLNGGNDTIVLDGSINDPGPGFGLDFGHVGTRVAGDVKTLSVAGKVVGGDDRITVLAYGGGAISGDVLDADASSGSVIGGDDLIDASANGSRVELFGDVEHVYTDVWGGNDVLIGSATVGSLLVGDVGMFLATAHLIRAGADTLVGGAGADSLYGELGAPFVGERDVDEFTFLVDSTYTGDDKLYGGGGNDRMFGQVGDDTLDGGMGNDIMDGGSQTTGTGDIVAFDTVHLQVTVDLIGGFAIGQGVDTLTGFESIRGSTRSDSLAGDNLANRIEGLDGDDQIFGRDGADTLIGGAGNDVISGGAGNDKLDGGAGADLMTGGSGNDTFYVDNVADQVIESAAGGADTVLARINYALGAGLEVEKLKVNGSAGLVLSGNELGNHVIGGAGDDTLIGGAGNDNLNGQGGADIMTGGSDDDTYYVDDAADQALESAGGGADTVFASVNYGLAAGSEIETLRVNGAAGLVLSGNELGNYVIGGAGDDTISGGAGNDRLKGREGADRFVFDTAFGPGNVDRILDFDAAVDQIWLDHLVCPGLTLGSLDASQFAIGSATGAGPQIVYNDGKLYFDGNGASAGGATHFATVTLAPDSAPLAASSFVVI